MTLWIAIECIVSQVTKMDEKPLQPVIFRHTKPSFLAHETPVSDTQNPYFRHTESSFSTHRTLVSDTRKFICFVPPPNFRRAKTFLIHEVNLLL